MWSDLDGNLRPSFWSHSLRQLYGLYWGATQKWSVFKGLQVVFFTKDKETRIISFGEEKIERWQSFASEELGVVWNLKHSQWAPTSLGRMKIRNTECGTSDSKVELSSGQPDKAVHSSFIKPSESMT